MKIPLDIVVERLKSYDPSYIVELLNLSSEDIIERFTDIIQQREEYLQGELEIFTETDNEEQDYDDDGLYEESYEEDV